MDFHGDFVGMMSEHLDLGIGQIILVQVGNIFEELKPSFVVEEKGWQCQGGIFALLKASPDIIEKGKLKLLLTNVNDGNSAFYWRRHREQDELFSVGSA